MSNPKSAKFNFHPIIGIGKSSMVARTYAIYELIESNRRHVIRSTRWLTAEAVGPMAMVWLAERRIFAINIEGTLGFAAYQFDDSGTPLQVIGQVIAVLHDRDAYQLGLWFINTTTCFENAGTPVESLRSNPKHVIEVAKYHMSMRFSF